MASISPLLPSTHHLHNHNQFPLKTLSLAKAVSSSPPYPSAIIPRRSFVAGVSITTPFLLPFSASSIATDFYEIEGSDGVKSLELRTGEGEVPSEGDQVAIHYYGRLAAKQGWRFDSTYDHKDEMGNPIPFVFIIGSSKVISGIEVAVKSMKVGGILRVIIPPSQGYQNRSQEPIPPDLLRSMTIDGNEPCN